MSLAEKTLGGPCSLLERVCRVAVPGCSETQEEHLSGVQQEIRDCDDSGMMMTMEQVVTQLRQEVFTLKAQGADQSGLSDAVRAINVLGTAQAKKDTPSLIDVKGFGRPKAFSGKEEDFQQWSKKTEAFFAYVIQESEKMLGWSAEQETEITTMAIDLELLPTEEFGTRSSKPGGCVAADAYSTHDSHELWCK